MKTLFFLIIAGNCYAGQIQIIAHTKNSKYIYNEMTPSEYVRTLVLTKKALDEKVVHNLDNFTNRGKSWKLKKFSLGIGTTGEIGIGPYKIGKSFKQRFVYSR